MEKKYAILIDGDNIAPSYLDSIISEVSKEGEVNTNTLTVSTRLK